MTTPDVDQVVHEIHEGRVRKGSVRSRLPECVTRTRFGPGPVMVQSAAVLAAVTTTATRCAPWLRCYVGPRLWSVCAEDQGDWCSCSAVWQRLPDGRIEYEHTGLACWPAGAGVVLVARSRGLPKVMTTVHHEIWHAVEHTGLAPDDVAVIDVVAARGTEQPGHYLASALERRARLYAAWASARDEGWRPGCPLRRVDRVCEYVYSGGLARDVARRGVGRSQVGLVGHAKTAAGMLVSWPMPAIWITAGLVVAARWGLAS